MNGSTVSSLVGLYNYLQREDKDYIRLFKATQVCLEFNRKNYDSFSSTDQVTCAGMMIARTHNN
jgi:hypothetical protein